MIYILHFIFGASWAIALVGVLFFIYHFYFLGLLFSGLIGASFGLILALISYLLLRILNSDKIRNQRS
ncbi:hypothetical protein [Campylobacter vicugnae]|uniref:hypothetical protein n=1 Tax=Campylobacter vicugnae TaxID=1660076 RepID=UPI00112FB858|nr:hypothetical protein [Campylobacter sp. RM8835]